MIRFREISRSFCTGGLLALLLAAICVSTSIAQSAAANRPVTITSEPGASVWIGGVLYGKCGKDGKLTIKSAPSGVHTLKVRAAGFKERSIPLGTAAKVDVVLTKTTDPAELAFQDGERLSTVDRQQAAEAFQKALKLRPAYLDAALSLARVRLDAGDVDEAQAAIVAARKISPANSQASAIQGRIYKEDGEQEKAIAAYKRAITEGRGTQPEAYAGLGLLYKERAESAANQGNFDDEQSNYAESAKNLKTALKQLSGAPDSIVIYQLIGVIYEKQKRYDDAIAVYQEFLRIFPDAPEATAVESFIVQLKKRRLP